MPLTDSVALALLPSTDAAIVESSCCFEVPRIVGTGRRVAVLQTDARRARCLALRVAFYKLHQYKLCDGICKCTKIVQAGEMMLRHPPAPVRFISAVTGGSIPLNQSP